MFEDLKNMVEDNRGFAKSLASVIIALFIAILLMSVGNMKGGLWDVATNNIFPLVVILAGLAIGLFFLGKG